MNKSKVLVIVGPTAAGKSQLALSLAQDFDIEIISLDSVLIYRYMDIGTDKPNLKARGFVPHHLLDIIDPTDYYSVGRYLADYARVVKDIHARGKLPVLVGGTMMYHHALTQGLNYLPETTPASRLAVRKLKEQNGLEGLYKLLKKIDPIAAARLNPEDSQRIERALDVFYLSKRPISSFYTAKIPGLLTPDTTFTIALIPEHRLILHKKIELRFSEMLERGFVEEVQELKKRFPELSANHPAMRAVGYRQIFQYLNGQIKHEDMIKQSIYATRQLAKRQLTWLRKLTPELTLRDYPDCRQDYKTAIARWYN